MMPRGKLITFEGIDGAGKSTHIETVSSFLKSQGISVIQTREPGGTGLGEKLRALLLSEAMDMETEALLMFAARREHIARVIQPALNRGEWVISDRFADASFAYQGAGRGLSWQKLLILEKWVLNDLKPDLTFLFDLDPSVARQRLQGTGNSPDRFEQEQSVFFEKVRQGYHRRVAEDPNRFCVIDAEQRIEEIKKLVEDCLPSVCI